MIRPRSRSVEHVPFRLLLAAVGALLLPSTAHAEPVTLARVMAIASESAPSVAVAGKRVGVAQAGFASADKLLRFNPALQAGFDTDAPFDNEGDRTISFGLSQTLEVGGQQGLRRDIARADVASANADLRRNRNDLAGDVITAFFALDTARRQVAVEKQIVEIYRKLAAAGRTMEARGAITRLDLATIEIETARVEAQLERDQGVASGNEHELAGLVGRAAMTIEPMTDERPATEVPSVEDVLARAVATRPELAAARAKQRSAVLSGTLAAREVWLSPTLSVGVRNDRIVHGVTGFRFAPGGVPNLLGVDNRYWIASVDVSLPLPIFEQRNTDRVRAEANLDVASAEERAFGVRIEAEVRAAVARANAAARALETQEKVRPTMEEAAVLYESAFARGATTVSETLLGEERVLRARLNYFAVRGEFLRARAMVDRVAGTWATP